MDLVGMVIPVRGDLRPDAEAVQAQVEAGAHGAPDPDHLGDIPGAILAGVQAMPAGEQHRWLRWKASCNCHLLAANDQPTSCRAYEAFELLRLPVQPFSASACSSALLAQPSCLSSSSSTELRA